MIQTAYIHIYMKIFQLFRGEGSLKLSEDHNALSSAATPELLCFRERLGEPTAELHSHRWDTLWEQEAWVLFKQMIFLKPW